MKKKSGEAVPMVQADELLMGHRASHLRSTVEEATVTEYEYAALHLMEAFRRWTTQCTRASATYDVGYNELLVLHVVRMQDRPKDAATIANILNREDIPNVQYSLRKLVSLDLVKKGRTGTSFTFTVTARGQELTDRYAEMRRELLMPQFAHLGDFRKTFVEARRVLMLLTGIYDQTARVAATYGSGYALTEPPTTTEAGAEKTPPKPRKKAAESAKRRKAP